MYEIEIESLVFFGSSFILILIHFCFVFVDVFHFTNRYKQRVQPIFIGTVVIVL